MDVREDLHLEEDIANGNIIGATIGNRFLIESHIATGSFAEVYKAHDNERDKDIAVKLFGRMNINNIRTFRVEVNMLAKITNNWDNGGTNCIGETPTEHFIAARYRWICLDLCGPNLREYMMANHQMGLPIKKVQNLLSQILSGVAFLHKNGIIHADLKPENVVFSDFDHPEESGTVKIIDFGNAVSHNANRTFPITSAYYRAVEVWLNIPWCAKADIWSVGCIALELFTGSIVFQTCHDHSYLRAASNLVKKGIPKRMQESTYLPYFKKNGSVIYCRSCSETEEMAQLSNLLLSDDPQLVHFSKLCAVLLKLLPLRRATAEKALKHKFFTY